MYMAKFRIDQGSTGEPLPVEPQKKRYMRKKRYMQKKRYIWHQRWHLTIAFDDSASKKGGSIVY